MAKENKREETVKNEIAKRYFPNFDTTETIGAVDFTVAIPTDRTEFFHGKHYLLWAEAKSGTKHNIQESIIQLILTIGKEKTYSRHEPPLYLGAFDEEKMIFVPYHAIQDIFFVNDFNWNVTPSDHNTKEFQQLTHIVANFMREHDTSAYLFHYNTTDRGLERFIKDNFKLDKQTVSQIPITKNNFIFIYQQWCEIVRPTIAINWESVKKDGVLDGYFFIADMMCEDNDSIYSDIHVMLRHDHYDLDRHVSVYGTIQSDRVDFNDGMRKHQMFWTVYQRPPRDDTRKYILDRQDLLVPQDVRERKGSYFTPQIWVNKSQEYLAEVLGENWQEDYYVWDCCAGTGNMEVGLRNRYRVWASTLDMADVRIMWERIERGANLLRSHCFQFDFLNDPLDATKLPPDLLEVLNDPDKRKKLIIYINPPYAEAGDAKQSVGTGQNKAKVATETLMYQRYKTLIGKAVVELFAQFFIRVYREIPGAWLAEFSKLKHIQAPNFAEFRQVFAAKLEKAFLVPATTFDNVKGHFPIGFFIWNTSVHNNKKNEFVDVFNAHGESVGTKCVHKPQESERLIGEWLTQFKDNKCKCIGMMNSGRNDFQNQKYCFIANSLSVERTHALLHSFTARTIIPGCIYLSVRHCIEATWLNDRDQFLYPNDGWKTDYDFQSDCLAYTLFHGQNRITSAQGTNHWIPFTEEELNAPMAFSSHFMSDFIAGKIKETTDDSPQTSIDTSAVTLQQTASPIHFTPAAQAVMDAGKAIWYYYIHINDDKRIFGAPTINVNASFYDIRAYFQGRDDKGKMNNDSSDQHYMSMLQDLRQKQRVLAKQIEEKVYQYGFLYGENNSVSEAIEQDEAIAPVMTPNPQLKEVKKNESQQ